MLLLSFRKRNVGQGGRAASPTGSETGSYRLLGSEAGKEGGLMAMR